VRDLARSVTKEAVATLLDIMTDAKAPAAARVAAAVAVLDRGWGRPPQAVAVAVEADGGRAYEAMLMEVERLERARGQGHLLAAQPRPFTQG
jgi:hypothetical protein